MARGARVLAARRVDGLDSGSVLPVLHRHYIVARAAGPSQAIYQARKRSVIPLKEGACQEWKLVPFRAVGVNASVPRSDGAHVSLVSA